MKAIVLVIVLSAFVVGVLSEEGLALKPKPKPKKKKKPVDPTPKELKVLMPIPAGINPGLSAAPVSFLYKEVGRPTCELTKACFNCKCKIGLAKIANNLKTAQLTPKVSITGFKPFVEAVERVFTTMKAATADANLQKALPWLNTAGSLCCRAVKKSNGLPGKAHSNHAFGLAFDLYFGPDVDPRGDGKTQTGLSYLAPYFVKERLYWAAGYKGSEEDAMHWEASKELLAEWKLKKLL
jgi:hypothetical protein